MNDDDKRPEENGEEPGSDKGREPDENELPPPGPPPDGYDNAGGPVPENIPPPPPRPAGYPSGEIPVPEPAAAVSAPHDSRGKFPELAPIGDEYVPPPPPSGTVAQYAGDQTPGKVTALGVMFLVGGIMSVLVSLSVAMGSMCLWVIWIYELTVGILCIVHGANMLSNKTTPPSRVLSILMIFCILDCNPVTMVLGILTLIFGGDPEVRSWYAARGIGY